MTARHYSLPIVLFVLALAAVHTAAADSVLPADFDAAMQQLAQELRAKNFSGIVSVEVAGQSAFQYASPGIDTRSVFWVGSVSKQFGATAALRLVDQGKLSLDEPIAGRLGLTGAALARNGRGCTLAEVLTHTCGLPAGNVCVDFEFRNPRARSKFLDCVADLKLESDPGTQYAYSNVGYDLIGVLVAATAGAEYEDFLRREFLTPLGMNDTGVTLAQNSAAKARLIQGRAFYGFGWAETWPWLLLLPDGPGAMGASGNIFSTADDLHAWNRRLHRGQVLGEATYRRMITPVLEDYGFGVAVEASKQGVQWIWHNGSITPMGWSSFVAYVPSLDASIVGLANRGRHTSYVMDATRSAVLAVLGDPIPSPMLKDPGRNDYVREVPFFVVPVLVAASVLMLLWYFVRGPRERPLRWLVSIDVAALMFLFAVIVFDFSGRLTWLALPLIAIVTLAILRHRRHLRFSLRDTWRNAKERNAVLGSLFSVGVVLLVAPVPAKLCFGGLIVIEAVLVYVLVGRRHAADPAARPAQ